MRILWISHFLLFPDTGYGALQRSKNLLKVLSEYHEVDVICLYRDVDKMLVPDVKRAEQDLKKYCNKVYLIPHSGSRLKKAFFLMKSFLTKVPYSVSMYRSKTLMNLIMKIVSENKIDLIHSDTIGMIEPILKKMKTIKVLNHHDIESHKMYRRYTNENNLLKHYFLRHEYTCLHDYEKNHCGAYDLNIVVSDLDKDRLREIDSSLNVEIIENGVDCDYFTYHPRDRNSNELIFTGALDYYPNVKAMYLFCTDIYPILKDKCPGIKLTIIGKNPPDQLKTFLGSLEDIDLVGYVDDIRPYIERAKVFVCPINEGGGTRIKILDAFSQGIPVVSTEVGAEGLMLEHGKHLYISKTNSEFADSVSVLLGNNEISGAMSLHAREFVEENYSFKNIGKTMATVYQNLLVKNTH